MNKEDSIKEKFKQALSSTDKVISDEYKMDENFKQKKRSQNYNFFEFVSYKSFILSYLTCLIVVVFVS